jgi:hypothetical protein
MLDADDDALHIEFDPPEPDLTYRNYLRTCEMLGVTPVSREQALGLIAEWTATIAACLTPPTQHQHGAAISTSDIGR